MKIRPRPGFLDGCDKLKVVKGKQIWASKDRDRLYTWDGMHGEIEAFNKQGHHLGAFDGITGDFLKDAVEGRTIDD